MTEEEAIKILEKEKAYMLSHGGDRQASALSMAIKALEQEPKTGRWIEHFDESGKWYECDQCHTDWGGSVNYCPNCGTKMVEPQERSEDEADN